MNRARRGVALFLGVIPPLVALPLLLRARYGGPRHPAFDFACLVALVWTPALAALIARGTFHERSGGSGFRFDPARDAKWFALAILAPFMVAALGYGAAWGSGLASFELPAAAPWPAANGAARFVAYAGANLGAGLAVWLLLALGEEIGWRGYLLPHLLDARLPLPVLCSGLVWGAWHVPSVLWGAYPAGPNRALSAVILMITLPAFAFVLARLRLESGSIWPPTLAHATWNSAIFDSQFCPPRRFFESSHTEIPRSSRRVLRA